MSLLSGFQAPAPSPARPSAWRPGIRTAAPALRYALAAALFGLALAARFSLVGILPDRGFPFLTFFPAVILAAFLAGFGPGLLAAGLSIAAAWYYFIPPGRAFGALATPDAVALVFFSVILLIDCVVIDLMNRALDGVHRTQRLLRASEHRVRHVLDRLFVAAGVLDLDGTLRELNEASQQLGPLDRRDAVGRRLWDLPWWDGDASRQAQVQDAITRAGRGETVRLDIALGRASPQPRTVDFQVAPLHDPEGRIVALVACAVDVTPRLQALADLREADRQKDTFLATLSHELRNPLAPIRAGAHVIALSPQADERLRRAAAVIERQSALLTRLVDDLLDVSRLKFGSLVLQTACVDVRRVVEAAVETSRPQIDATGLDFRLELPDAPLTVQVDEARLAQCVSNLVNNACKFTPAPGRITLRVQAAGPDRVSVCVSDTGQGIAPDMLGKIFELFAQERRSGMGGNTGLGIGLALTRRLVEIQGGEIRVHSEGPGHGTRFEILLPRAREAARTPDVGAR